MKRTFTALLAAAALSAPALATDPVALGEIAIGPELMEKGEDYGQRELDRLAGYMQDHLERQLADMLGDGGYTLDVTILDAMPNRPTMQQMAGTTALHMSSFSIGGAEVEARLLSASGDVLESYSYSWRSHSIRDVVGYATWTDARRTFDRFARQIRTSLEERAETGS